MRFFCGGTDRGAEFHFGGASLRGDAAFTLACAVFAARAFGTYQRAM